MLDNTLVILLMVLPFLIFVGLKYQTYRKQKKMEVAEEINSILNKHGKTQYLRPSSQDTVNNEDFDKDKAA